MSDPHPTIDLGLVTIGQTPRPDLEAIFRPHAPAAVVAMRGALDGLARSEIDDLARVDGGYPLLVRLVNADSVTVDRSQILPRVARAAGELAAAGARLVVVLCAGDFPRFDCSAPLLLPGQLLPAVVGALSPTRRIGIVTPIAGQAEAARAKWMRDGFEPMVAAAAPANTEEIDAAAERLRGQPLDLILLDCMGHGPADRQRLAERTGRPVLLARTLVAQVAGAMVDSTNTEPGRSR